MTIYRAAELKDTVLAAIADAQALDIDLRLVEEIDTSGIQLLLLARREAARQEKPLRLIGHSAAVREGLAMLGFGEQLDPIGATA
ncbi:STAS domain-containing protein [Pigmentiphaga aceris]|uniref:STAS domain-containing protein n=2 Tax=Pigmentiphaga aceris TaxID=1940612 RepID=A0A5C0B3K8_9BURK|nr:STAS domain-containing protein [Pigmentiphaga aceris]